MAVLIRCKSCREDFVPSQCSIDGVCLRCERDAALASAERWRGVAQQFRDIDPVQFEGHEISDWYAAVAAFEAAEREAQGGAS